MAKPKKKTEKKRRKISIKRLILKGIWFSLLAFAIFMLGIMVGGSLVGLSLSSDDILTRNSFIMIAWLDALVLSGLMTLFIFLLRKKKRTLIRWTRRSFTILSVLVLIATLVTSIILVANFDNENFLGAENQSQTPAESNAVAGNADYSEGLTFDNAKLLEGTNRERGGAGVNPLTISDKLNASAQKKCEDMVAKNYWSHNDPQGNEPWHFFTDAGYSYNDAGENLAYGYIKEGDVITGWMNSPAHKENLLATKFTEVGFGVCKSDNYVDTGKQLIVVQHFARPGTSNARSGGGNSAPVQKPYVASVCTKTPIPYQTTYENVSYLYVGETSSYGGYEGYTSTCTADSEGYTPPSYTISPIDKTVLVGTKPKPETEPAP